MKSCYGAGGGGADKEGAGSRLLFIFLFSNRMECLLSFCGWGTCKGGYVMNRDTFVVDLDCVPLKR